jgi:hypothetical protein
MPSGASGSTDRVDTAKVGVARVTLGTVAVPVLNALVVFVTLHWFLDESVAVAAGYAMAVAGLLLVPAVLLMRSHVRLRPLTRRERRWSAACFGGVLGLLTATVLSAVGVPVGVAVAAGVVVAAVQFVAAGRGIRRGQDEFVKLPLSPRTLSDSVLIEESTRRRLSRTDLPPDERTEVTLRRLAALVDIAGRPGTESSIHEAVTEAHRITDDEAQPWRIRFEAARALVAAWDTNAARSGDDAGYEAALAILERLASCAPADLWAAARVECLASRALHRVWMLSERATPPDDETERIAWATARQSDVLDIVALTDEALATIERELGGVSYNQRSLRRLRAEWAGVLNDDVDAVVEQARALTVGHGTGPDLDDGLDWLTLAAALLRRAEFADPSWKADLDQACSIARQVRTRMPDLAILASRILADAERLRDDLSRGWSDSA